MDFFWRILLMYFGIVWFVLKDELIFSNLIFLNNSKYSNIFYRVMVSKNDVEDVLV